MIKKKLLGNYSSWMLTFFKSFVCLFVCVQGSEYTRSLVDKKKEGSVVSMFIVLLNKGEVVLEMTFSRLVK